MKREIEIKVPNDWSAVTLREYIRLSNDLQNYEGDDEAITATLFHHLAKFDVRMLKDLDVETYTAIKEKLYSFLQNTNYPIQREIDIDGVKYGFEPNLSQMAYGAYVDISKYDKLEINDKWAEVMSILYRPIIKRYGKLYDIIPYEGLIDSELFLDVTMDVHFGCLFFFVNLSKDLWHSTLSSLMQTSPELVPHKLKSILERSGNPTLP